MILPGNSNSNRVFLPVIRPDRRGQATVELVVCLPVILILVLVTYNIGLYLSACARFDPLAAEAVRTQATSPGNGEFGRDTRASLVQDCLTGGMGDSYDVTISVSIESISYGNLGSSTDSSNIVFSLLPQQERVICTMEYYPRGIPQGFFGISLPPIQHRREFVIDPYRPGALF